MLERSYLLPAIRKDLERKMVFVAGPRQVGKTTLAKQLPGGEKGYLNWDVAADRAKILSRELPNNDLWVFDEIHKYRGWRNYLKGLFDGRESSQRILVTGSARLDLYRRAGDSLQGRYHLHRLHPLTVAELGGDQSALDDLMRYSGFPEPFFARSERESRRWSREYRSLLVREEVTSLERIDDLGKLELLMMRLPERVGSPLSLNSLREDLEVSHRAITRWVAVLERLYAIFRVSPIGSPRIRAIRKAPKHYHFDWTLVENEAARFENLVASHLLKHVHREQDQEGRDLELGYFRDRDGREVDFVVSEKRKPILAVECKLSETTADRNVRYFKERFPTCEAWQIARTATKEYRTPEGVRVAPAIALLRDLT
jgi:predicted AAA+ superfamily ATPase